MDKPQSNCENVDRSKNKVDRVSIPDLPYGDERINTVKSGNINVVGTGRAGGAVLISISLSGRRKRRNGRRSVTDIDPKFERPQSS